MQGWNDPPKNVQPTGHLKINLNKRVAFPLGSAPAASSHDLPSALPPLLPPMSPPKAIELISRVSNSKNDEIETKSDDDNKEQCLRAHCILKVAANQIENPAKDTILTKLDAFDDDWKDCEKDIRALLVELTDYLEAEDYKNTAAVHRKIVLKGYNKPWIASVRQIFTSMERLKEKSDEDLTAAIVNPLDIPNEELNSENQLN